MSEPVDRSGWDRLSPAQIYLLAAIVLGIGVLVAPLVYHDFDVRGFFLPWSRATGGTRPQAVYAEDFYPDCNYPPVVPYLLTLVERVRRLAHAPKVGALSLTLLKLPSLLAYAACVPLCLVGLRSPFGGSQARVAAVCCALCVPLFINAALWGQWDTITAALILASVVALLHERPAAAEALMGLAFQVDLGGPRRLVRVELLLGERPALYAQNLHLLVSEEGRAWRRVPAVPARPPVEAQLGGSKSQVLLLDAVEVRRLRIAQVGKRRRPWGAAELRIHVLP